MSEALFDQIERLGRDRTVESREALLSMLSTASDLQGEKEFPVVASASHALLAHGAPGVRALVDLLYSAADPPEGLSETELKLLTILQPLPGVRRSDHIITALWCAGRAAQVESSDDYGTWRRSVAIDEPTRTEARRAFDELLVAARFNDLLHTALSRAMSTANIRDDPGPNQEEERALAALRHEIATRGMLPLSARMVRQFATLVEAEETEQKYQEFLVEHPVFLDPIAAEVVAQKPLGLELRTDFVIRRHDYEYLVVEIEKPQDRIFTQKGDFTAAFFHAFGQVLEFQAWLDQHVSYARQHMPKIANPRGVVVIGRDPTDPSLAEKLRRFRINSSMVDVLTYDRVLQRARNLYQSLYGHTAD
jgi:hypothetical protein